VHTRAARRARTARRPRSRFQADTGRAATGPRPRRDIHAGPRPRRRLRAVRAPTASQWPDWELARGGAWLQAEVSETSWTEPSSGQTYSASRARSAYLLKRQAESCIVMRRHVDRFSPGVMAGQCWTSSKLRPQPLHWSSPWLVEQMAMHGVSGVVWYHVSQASHAFDGKPTSSTSSSWWNTMSA